MRWPFRRRFPAAQQIRGEQEAAVARIEAQLAAGVQVVEVEGRLIRREAAWAATSALRKAWEVGGRPDGQNRLGDGTWAARVERADGSIELHDLGLFPG